MSDMSESNRESLSALLDNEADELELRRLIKLTGENRDLAQRWRRYSLVQTLLHGQDVAALSPGFNDRVADAIASEQITADRNWRRSAGKFAIAASVAVLAFAGLQIALQPATLTSDMTVQNENTNLPAIEPQAVLVAGESVAREVDPIARQRLEDYINRASIIYEPPTQLEYIQDSPLYRLVNEVLPQAANQ